MDDDTRREIIRQSIGLVAVGVAVLLVDPAQRREVALAWRRLTADVRQALANPSPRLPHPWELSALHDEARRITRDATIRGEGGDTP